jgi:uncharacterized DUF497 family protein
MCLEFEWDENKRQEVIKKRCIDVLYAALIFEGDVLTRIDDRQEYGETRLFRCRPHRRGGITRLVTAWKGGRNGRAEYEAGIAGRYPPDEGKR